MPLLNRRIFDLGLSGLKSEATSLYITNAEPTTWLQATNTPANSGYRLGSHITTAGSLFGAPYDYSSAGWRIDLVPITLGNIDYTGTATFFVVTDDTNQRLLLVNNLFVSRTLRIGGNWSLDTFSVYFAGWV